MKVEDYVWWDDFLKRYDVTDRALLEQTDPEVKILIKLVHRSWFIPISKPIQLPLIGGEI